jgi:hypothetical protein
MADVTYNLAQFTSLAPGTTPQAGQIYKSIEGEPLLVSILSGVSIRGGDVVVVLTATPDTSQQSALDSIIANHDGLGTAEDQTNSESFPVVTLQEVNGVDFGTFLPNTESHVTSTTNPHNTNLANIGQGTISDLNSALQDANVDDSGSPRDPNAHASSHALGGLDALVLQDLSSGGAAENLVPATNASGGFDLVPLEAMDAVPAISIYNTVPGLSLSTNGSFAGIAFDGVNAQDSSYFSFSPGTSQVVILRSGQYEVTSYFTTEQTGGNSRSEASFRVTRSNSIIGGMQSGNYSRQISQGLGNGSVTQVLFLNQGDIISFQARRESGSGTLRPAGNGCGLVITLKQGIRGPQGPQGEPGTGSTILVDDDGVFAGSFTRLNFLNSQIVDTGGGVATVQAMAAPPAFFVAREDANLNFSGGTARDRVTLSETGLDNGTYEVQAYAEHFSTSSSTEWTVTLLQDGIVIAQQQVEPEDRDDRFQFSCFDVVDVVTGSINLVLRIQRRTGSGSLNISRARILLKKIS